LSCDRIRRGPVVAGQHYDLDAFGCQRLQRIRRRRLDGIGDGKQPAQFAVDRDVDDRSAIAAQAFALLVQRLGFDAERGQEVRVAEQDSLAVDLAGRAFGAEPETDIY
jgi:hypothetical protein